MANSTTNTELTQALEIATGEASSAMKRWSSGKVTLTLDGVDEVPIPEIAEFLGLTDKLQVMVVLQIMSEMGGSIVLSFDEPDGRRVADALMPTQWDESGCWSDLQQSALMETGNIVACAYLNAITEASQFELVPSPPFFVSDYGASVVEQLLMPHTMTADTVLVHRVSFCQGDEPLKGVLLFLPTEGLESAIKVGLKQSHHSLSEFGAE